MEGAFRVLGSVMIQCGFLISECKTVSEANPDRCQRERLQLEGALGFEGQ